VIAAALLASAVLLGALSFFEPCTIATHTLFSVRAHARPRAACLGELALLWASRSLLAAGLLVAVAAFVAAPDWGGYRPSLALAAMASVYLVSRFVYIPVPHLEFWRLLPSGDRWPQAVKLGLTLPACTLPLFLILATLAATSGSRLLAAAAGVLFASLFTLPTALAALTGLAAAMPRLLKGAALATPYLTAALLYGAALYLLP
jgi:cytochrome c-type biogenesis protein